MMVIFRYPWNIVLKKKNPVQNPKKIRCHSHTLSDKITGIFLRRIGWYAIILGVVGGQKSCVILKTTLYEFLIEQNVIVIEVLKAFEETWDIRIVPSKTDLNFFLQVPLHPTTKKATNLKRWDYKGGL